MSKYGRMFVKEPNEDLFQVLFDHQWIQVFEVLDCKLDYSSSLEVVDGFDHKSWCAIMSIQKCHGKQLGLIRCFV